MSQQITIDYPSQLPDALQETPEQFEDEARRAMAIKLFELHRIPSGIAAELAGMSRVQFLMELHKYNVPMIDIAEDELDRDIENA